MDSKKKKLLIVIAVSVVTFALMIFISGQFVSAVSKETYSTIKPIAYWVTILFGLTVGLIGLLFWKIHQQEVLLTHLMKKTICLKDEEDGTEASNE